MKSNDERYLKAGGTTGPMGGTGQANQEERQKKAFCWSVMGWGREEPIMDQQKQNYFDWIHSYTCGAVSRVL
jgi:hypothetical protein